MDAAQVILALRGGLEDVASQLPGKLGVAVHFVDDDLQVRLNAHELFPAASVIKVPIMAEVYHQAAQGALSLDDVVPVLPEDLTNGSGILKHLHVGLPLTLRDAVELMITVSDNTATNMVLRCVGTAQVNAWMQELGLENTRSAGPIRIANNPVSLSERSRTTPADMTHLLLLMARRELVGPEASQAMLDTLEHQQFDDMLPRYLPFTWYPERLGLTAMPVRIAHKTGSLSGVRNDAGVMIVDTLRGQRTAAVSVFTSEVEDHDLWTPENVAVLAVARVGRLVYDALHQLAA